MFTSIVFYLAHKTILRALLAFKGFDRILNRSSRQRFSLLFQNGFMKDGHYIDFTLLPLWM